MSENDTCDWCRSPDKSCSSDKPVADCACNRCRAASEEALHLKLKEATDLVRELLTYEGAEGTDASVKLRAETLLKGS
jgi:hypothetical protein